MLITIFAPAHVHLLEVAGLRDAFFEANARLGGEPHYRLRLVSEDGAPLKSASGVVILPDAGLREATLPSDTLIVVGPYGVPDRPGEALAAWLRDQAANARRYGSTCTGAFILANVGLLVGRDVTTHWQYARRLANDHPDLTIEPDRIFVRDGPVFTSAGVAAALDLAFSLIEEDHGRELALWVARRLVVFLKRPGGQSQFSDTLTAQTADRGPIDRARLHILENPRDDLSLASLADAAGTSVRTLSRLFHAELGVSPSAYVGPVRLDLARRRLEEGAAPTKAIAYAVGFGSTSTMRRAFLREIGVTPSEYRQRFRTSADGASDEGGAILA